MYINETLVLHYVATYPKWHGVKLHTVKPVLRSHIGDQQVYLQDKWSLTWGSIHMDFSMTCQPMWPFNSGYCIMEVTTWTGLTESQVTCYIAICTYSSWHAKYLLNPGDTIYKLIARCALRNVCTSCCRVQNYREVSDQAWCNGLDICRIRRRSRCRWGVLLWLGHRVLLSWLEQ